jgi:hypothetical protein
MLCAKGEIHMEVIEKKSCTYEGETYIHGSEVEQPERNLICINGKWVDKDDLESRGC